MKSYVYEYYHDGGTWVIEIIADSHDDSEARLKKMPHAKYLGELVMKVPARLGWFAKMACWVRNWMERRSTDVV